jgi:hypothetical protein
MKSISAAFFLLRTCFSSLILEGAAVLRFALKILWEAFVLVCLLIMASVVGLVAILAEKFQRKSGTSMNGGMTKAEGFGMSGMRGTK